MTWVKICGMTNLEDALVAVDAGADAVGFVFYEKSPRCVTVETAREIVEKLPESVEKIGVFVGSDAESVLSAKARAGLTAAQIYPNDRNQFSMLKLEFLDACRSILALPEAVFSGTEDRAFGLSSKVRDRIYAMLLDSGTAESPGGSGKKLDFRKSALIRKGIGQLGMKVIAAGGLSPQNVAEAISILDPWGVDVVSGVEASPGKKDPEKVRAFVRAVREMDRRVG
jgi:phosphoribosylanthranilate isomerase